VLLRGINNLGSKKVAMAELREVVTSLGHADVMTYIQSGNVLFTPRLTGSRTAGRTDAAALAAELERAIADGIGVRARAVVLSREELARCVRDNPYPGETDPRLRIFRPVLAQVRADAERAIDQIHHHVRRELPVRPPRLLPGRLNCVIDRIPRHPRRKHQ
jgi:uncharacterized protein (DUF1697 family)